MSERSQAAKSRTFAALRFHNFRVYICCQAVSATGSWMQTMAQAWLVLQITGSGTAIGGVVAVQYLPCLLFAPFAGVLVDRFDRRKLLMLTQATQASLSFLLGTLIITGNAELWMVYVIAGCSGLVTATDNPTRQTFVMEMVGTAHVANAVTLNSVVMQGARIFGPAVGGVLIATVGIGPCFIYNGVSFLFVIVALAVLRVDELHRTARSPRMPGQLREGLSYAWNTPVLRTTLLMLVLLGAFTYEFTVTLPVLVKFSFGSDSGALAWMMSLMGAGSIVGGLITASLGTPTPRRLAVLCIAFGSLILCLAAAPMIIVAFLICPIIGAFSVSVNATANATLQLGTTTAAFRGRVMSLFAVTMMGTTPIGGPIVGYVCEHFSARWGIALGGAAALFSGFYGINRLSHRAADAADLEPAPARSDNTGPVAII